VGVLIDLKRFISKCRRSGFRMAIRLSLKHFSGNLKNIKWRMDGLRHLKSADFRVVFPDEGNVTVLLPKLRMIDAIAGRRAGFAGKSTSFLSRPSHEVLLRKIVFHLYKTGVVSRKNSIIDIGAWISDNAVVWSHLIDRDCAKVIAIDPSADNIAFGKAISQLNGVSNISYHQSVCSWAENLPLYFEGDIDHTAFSENKPSNNPPVRSTTIDSIVGEADRARIGLFHIDVEGFEKDVLRGAELVVSASRPIVLFEQHINEDDCDVIFEYFWRKSYNVYMINETLLGCREDCRNFLAAPKELDLTPLLNALSAGTKHECITAAVPGPALISVSGLKTFANPNQV
jgi:FkbM family methyltransferase